MAKRRLTRHVKGPTYQAWLELDVPGRLTTDMKGVLVWNCSRHSGPLTFRADPSNGERPCDKFYRMAKRSQVHGSDPFFSGDNYEIVLDGRVVDKLRTHPDLCESLDAALCGTLEADSKARAKRRERLLEAGQGIRSLRNRNVNRSRIRQRREELGLSAQGLADRVQDVQPGANGLTWSTILAIEIGRIRAPKQVALEILATALEIPLEEIAGKAQKNTV